MDFHAFMYVTVGRRHELERGMAGKDSVLYRRMLDEIAEYARTCDAGGWTGIGLLRAAVAPLSRGGGVARPAVSRGGEAAWGGYLVLADTQSEAQAWAEDCLWMWDAWSTPFGQDRPPLLIGDADTVTRMIEKALTHVPFDEMFLLFGQGILGRDRCLTTLELFAEKVIPRFR